MLNWEKVEIKQVWKIVRNRLNMMLFRSNAFSLDLVNGCTGYLWALLVVEAKLREVAGVDLALKKVREGKFEE